MPHSLLIFSIRLAVRSRSEVGHGLTLDDRCSGEELKECNAQGLEYCQNELFTNKPAYLKSSLCFLSPTIFNKSLLRSVIYRENVRLTNGLDLVCVCVHVMDCFISIDEFSHNVNKFQSESPQHMFRSRIHCINLSRYNILSIVVSV